MAGTHEITQDEKYLSKLLNYIKSGTADVKEYEEFERILVEHGIARSTIQEPLEAQRINGWEDLIQKRKSVDAHDFQKKNLYEGIVVGTLLGLGSYILYRVLSPRL